MQEYPEPPDPADAHHRFVQEMREIDDRFVQDMREMNLARWEGRFDKWLREKIADERRKAKEALGLSEGP